MLHKSSCCSWFVHFLYDTDVNDIPQWHVETKQTFQVVTSMVLLGVMATGDTVGPGDWNTNVP